MKRGKKFYYKGVTVNLLGLPKIATGSRKNENTHKRKYLRSFNTIIEENAPKNLLLIYDISEGKKKERDWFRRQLKAFSFIMIQRSVWVGPSPLPKEFVSYLKNLGLQKDFKTFKLAKAYINTSPL